MTKRTTVSMPAALYEKAEWLMKVHLHADLSGFIQELIRAEWNRTTEEIKRREGARRFEQLLADAKPPAKLTAAEHNKFPAGRW